MTTRYVHVVWGGAWPVIVSMPCKNKMHSIAYILVGGGGGEIMNEHTCTCLYNILIIIKNTKSSSKSASQLWELLIFVEIIILIS